MHNEWFIWNTNFDMSYEIWFIWCMTSFRYVSFLVWFDSLWSITNMIHKCRLVTLLDENHELTAESSIWSTLAFESVGVLDGLMSSQVSGHTRSHCRPVPPWGLLFLHMQQAYRRPRDHAFCWQQSLCTSEDFAYDRWQAFCSSWDHPYDPTHHHHHLILVPGLCEVIFMFGHHGLDNRRDDLVCHHHHILASGDYLVDVTTWRVAGPGQSGSTPLSAGQTPRSSWIWVRLGLSWLHWRHGASIFPTSWPPIWALCSWTPMLPWSAFVDSVLWLFHWPSPSLLP